MALLDTELDAQAQPVTKPKPLPIAQAPLPTPGASTGQLPAVAGPSAPVTPPQPAQPAIPNAPAAPTTTDPMAFQPPPGIGPSGGSWDPAPMYFDSTTGKPAQPPGAKALPTAPPPNPGFAPPGGYGTNTAAPQANGDPAAPAGFFDAFHAREASSAAALKNGPQPNAGGGYRDFTQTATGTAPTVSDAAGKASLHANQVADATAQLPGGNARFTDTMQGGTDFGAANPTTSTQDWINNAVARAESNNGGANPDARSVDAPLHGKPVPNTSGGSGWVGPDGQLHFPEGMVNTPRSETTRPILPTGPASDTGAGGKQPYYGDLGMDAFHRAPEGLGPSGPNVDPIEQAIASAGANTGGASTLTPVTPDTALTNYRISAGPQTDRFKIAQDRYAAAKAASEGGYEADLRRANEGAFGAGRGVSGMLRTSRGNIASDRQATLASQESNFLNDALTGSIDDAYKNIGIDQQQQGFEADQQKTGFGQGMALEGLADSRQKTGFDQNLAIQELSNAQTDAEFQRAMQKLLIGSQGDPAAIQAWLASVYGDQSAQSAESARRLAGV